MLATIIILAFIAMVHFLKLNGIKLLKQDKMHGAIIVLVSKMLFWLSIIEMVSIWNKSYLLYVLPISLVLFLLYVFFDRQMLFLTYKRKKNNTAN